MVENQITFTLFSNMTHHHGLTHIYKQNMKAFDQRNLLFDIVVKDHGHTVISFLYATLLHVLINIYLYIKYVVKDQRSFLYTTFCKVLIHIHTKYEGIGSKDKKVLHWTRLSANSRPTQNRCGCYNKSIKVAWQFNNRQ